MSAISTFVNVMTNDPDVAAINNPDDSLVVPKCAVAVPRGGLAMTIKNIDIMGMHVF